MNENEIEQLRVDAERYRWLRDKGFKFANVDIGTDCDGENFVEFKSSFRLLDMPDCPYEDGDWTTAQIDASIDAAIKNTSK